MGLQRALAASALAASAVFATAAAEAADPDPEVAAADALYRSAKEALARGDNGRACELLEQSLRLQPAPGTLLNLGECHARLGQWVAALDAFRQARERLAPGDYRVAFAERRISEIDEAAPHVELDPSGASPGDARVFLDDREVAAGSFGVPLAVDPGTHVVVVRAPQHREARTVVTLEERALRKIEIAPGPPDVPEPPAAVVPGPASPEDPGRAQRVWGFGVGGFGIVALGTGAILGLTAHATYDAALAHCPAGPASCTPQGAEGGHSAELQAGASTVAFVAAGAAIATGAALVFTAKKTSKVAVASQIAAGSALLSIRGSW